MNSMRTRGSRFTGLILFVSGLILIGVLIFLTVRSAHHDQGAVDEGAVSTTSSSPFVLDGNQPTDNLNQSGGSDLTIVGSISSNDNTVTTTNENVKTNGSGLPDTGTSGIVVATLALAAMAGAGIAYRDSRRHLARASSTRKTL